jgi:antitoxin (DNA-binding transcriptional repressor) of toxin-antitoxin stability system
MRIPVSTTWAARNLGDCLARIRHTDDRFVLLKNGKPVAELVPSADARTATLRELCNAMAAVPVDAEFSADLKAVNDADRPLDNPWDSSSTPRH